MEFQKIVNFLDTTSDNKNLPKSVTKIWDEVYDQSDLCDFSDAYIVVKGTITVTKKAITVDDIEAPNNTAANANATNTGNDNAFGEKKLVFKSNAPFINCI